MEEWAAVAAGGAMGALLRASLLRAVVSAAMRHGSLGLGLAPSLATLVANLLGCALLGAWVAGLASDSAGPPDRWATVLVATGICGGLTTFSTLCADLVWLRRDHGLPIALSYLGLSLGIGVSLLNLLLVAAH